MVASANRRHVNAIAGREFEFSTRRAEPAVTPTNPCPSQPIRSKAAHNQALRIVSPCFDSEP